MITRKGSRVLIALPIIASAMAASGCVSSPTYGTDKTANEQLLGDISGLLAVAPKDRERIDYKPRPELVKPATTTVLPAPQDNIVTAASDQWPESPEQQRARLRAEATANRDNPGFEPTIVGDVSAESSGKKLALGQSPKGADAGVLRSGEKTDQSAAFKAKLAETQQGSAANRKYLSEPPLDYRKPNETAPADELGEDEYKKERRLKAEARKAAGKNSWRDFVPGL